MKIEIIKKSEFDNRLLKRGEIKKRAMELKQSIAKSNRLALALLMHPDATPEQLWEIHTMIVESRQKALELQAKLQKYFIHEFKILGD